MSRRSYLRAAALLVVSFAAGCAGGGAGDERLSAAEVVDAVVVPRAQPPPSTAFVEEVRGETAASIPVEYGAPEARASLLDGMVAAVARLYVSPALRAAQAAGTLEAFKRNLERPGNVAILSWAAAYRNESSAEAALNVLEQALSTKPGLTAGPDFPPFGEAGRRFDGVAPEHARVPRRAYVWRTGALVLHVNADGSVAADAAAIDAVGRSMQDAAVNPDGGDAWVGG